MNKHFTNLGLMFFSLSLVSVAGYSPNALAQTTNFSCTLLEGIPTTVAHTERGKLPVIRWQSEHFSNSGYNSQKRCNIVSYRFQKFYDNGTLKFLTTGKMNEQNVVCVALQKDSDCSELLFTLQPGKDPGKTLKRLMNIRNHNSGPLSETYTRVYIDMNQYLEDISNETIQSEESANNTETLSKPKPLW